eukprot:scaffold7780_cov267-Pinguiococcus_pyrenoidosus.AAC.2
MDEFGRDLGEVKKLLPEKTMGDVLKYYYKWKCSPSYIDWRRREKVKKVEEDIPDWHNDVCEICDEGGDIICCDTCNLSYHGSCLEPKLEDVPEFWMCPACRVKFVSAADIAKVAWERRSGHASFNEEMGASQCFVFFVVWLVYLVRLPGQGVRESASGTRPGAARKHRHAGAGP